MKIWMILKTPQQEEETDQPQRSTLRPSTDPDVQPLHNLCSCQGTNQPDKLPGRGQQNIQLSYPHSQINFVDILGKTSYLSSIVRNSKTSTR